MIISAEDVEREVTERGIWAWEFRTCSICKTPLSYMFGKDGVALDTNCACVSYWIPPRPSSYADISNMINMQEEMWYKMWQDLLTSKYVTESLNPPDHPCDQHDQNHA